MSNSSVLVLDDDADVGMAAKLLLQRHCGPVAVLQRPAELMAALDRERPGLLLLDLNFRPGQTDGAQGLDLLRRVLQRPHPPAVVVMTAYAEVDLAVQAIKLGAQDFITKPWDNRKLTAVVQAAMTRGPTMPSSDGSPLLGESAPMRALRADIAQVAPTAANVLILGEMGVGKELVARALHAESTRRAGPFAAVDLGALPETTFESELFGHRRGAFTDARTDRPGRVLSAQGGTLFLDEVGNLPLSGQAKLLTVLERREVTPLGSDRAEPVDVRVVSATNLDAEAMRDPTRFRQDLLYRLNTIVLRVPPLRERREDIGLLTHHYLGHYAAQYGKPPRPLAEPARVALQAAAWPGNVRALRHACERAVILARGDRYEVADFQEEVSFALTSAGQSDVPQMAAASPPGPREDAPLAVPVTQTWAARERAALDEALAQSQGNLSEAARLLGLSRGALYRRLDKHGL